MRAALLIPALVAAGCRPEPSLPAPTSSPSPSAPLMGGRDASPVRTCEPAASCGVWLECQWFERVEAAPIERWRAQAGPLKGKAFRRRHHCLPADAGEAGCQVYCAGTGHAERCVDALRTEDEECTAHAVPRPAPFACEARGDACVRVERAP